MIERELDYQPITGPTVDRYNSRKDGDGQWAPRGPVTLPVGQTKKWSHIEAGVGTIISFTVGVGGNVIFLPLITTNMGVGITAAVTLTLAFMVLSYVRQYSLRRYFNWLQFRRS